MNSKPYAWALLSCFVASCAHETSSDPSQAPTASTPPQAVPEADPETEPGTQPAEEEAPVEAAVQTYSPQQLADELRFDSKKESPAWDTTVTVSGLAVRGPVEDGDQGTYYVPLADAMEHSMLNEVHCYVGNVSPEVEEGQSLVVTGVPKKPEYGPLTLVDCKVAPAP